MLAERLRREFGIDAVFEEPRPTYIERPVGVGEARYEFTPSGPNDFWQTIGLRVEPVPEGGGTSFRVEAERGAVPRACNRAVEESASRALQHGLRGWKVVDCAVMLTGAGIAESMDESPLWTVEAAMSARLLSDFAVALPGLTRARCSAGEGH